jgi:sugar phosphate isomerase/epimerase
MGKFGLQLYTVKEDAARDFYGTVARVAQIGYEGVEFADYFGSPAAELHRVLQDNHLEVAGSVAQMEVLEQGLEAAIEYARIIQCPALICPWLREELRTASGYARIADRFNHFARLCHNNGMGFLYHIHGYEFQDLGGKNGMGILAACTDPALVAFEVDVYWVEHGGIDAVEFMKQYGARSPYIHFKDMKDKVHMHDTEVGAGAIDMAGVMREGKRHGATWYIVEQEQFDMPPMESVTISLRNLKSLAEKN